MKIEELYSKLAEHKPEGAVKEGKEWSKGVLKALCNWKGTSFSDLCKAIGYDELDNSIKSYLETYFKRAKDGTLKAGGKGDFANQWIEWNKMIKDNKSIKEASNGKPQDELKEDGWRNIESIVGSLAVGLGEQIENVIREKREEAEEEAAALEDAKKYLDDMKESRKKEIEKEKERVAGIATREKELQFGNGDVNFEDLVKKLHGVYGVKLNSTDTLQKWFSRAISYTDDERGFTMRYMPYAPIGSFIELNRSEEDIIKEKKLYQEMSNYCSKYGALEERLPKPNFENRTYDKENISSKDAKELVELFKEMNKYAQKIRVELNGYELKPKCVKLSELIEELNKKYNCKSNKDGAKWFDKALRSVVLYLEKNQKDHYLTLIECFYDINEEERKIINKDIKRNSGSSVFDRMSEGVTRDKDKMIAGCKLAIVLANEFKNNKDTEIEEEQAKLVEKAFTEVWLIVASVLQRVDDCIRENADKKPLDKVYSELAARFKRKDSPKTDEEWFKEVIAALENYGDSEDKVRALVGDDKFDVGDWKELFAQEWNKKFCSLVNKKQEIIKKVKERSDAKKDNISDLDYYEISSLFGETFSRGCYVDKLLEYKRLNTAVNVKDIFDEIGKMYNKTGSNNQDWCKEIIEKLGDKNSFDEIASIAGYNFDNYDYVRKISPKEEYHKYEYSKAEIIKNTNENVRMDLNVAKASIEDIKDWAKEDKVLRKASDLIKEVFSIYLGTNYKYGVGYMAEILEKCKNSFEEKFGFFLDKELNKNLNEYYERFKKFVSVQDTFLNDKKDGFTTCDRLIYNYRKKVLPGLDERLKRIMKTKEDVIDGLKASGYTEKFENFEKVKGFKDFESNNIQALKLGAVVQILLEDGVAGNRGKNVKNAANATIGAIGKSLRVSGIDKTDERDFSKFILKANAQGKDLHDKDIKKRVNYAIIELINRLSTSVERAVEVDNDLYDTRFLVDIFLKKVSKALDGYGLREDTKDYQEAEDSNLKIKLVDEWITLREYGYKEKSSTATWIRNLSNEVDSMLESKINPEDKIKRFKKKLLDILKISSPKASVNDANVKKYIKEYVKELAEELDEFLEKIKNVNKLSIEFATKRGTYTEGEEKKEVEIDKEGIVICLANMIYYWSRALGKNGNPAAALQAGTIYDTLRSIVIDGGINSGVIIENYRWKKGSKTAEWLNKIEDDIVKKSKKLDPMEYLTNFRKNVNAFPSFTFKKAAVKFNEVQEAIEELNTALDHRIEQLAARLVFEINSALKSGEDFRGKLVGICNDIKFKKFEGYGRYFLIGSENRKKLDALINSRTPDSTLAALNVFEKSFNKYLKNIFEKNGMKFTTNPITLEKTSEKEVDETMVALRLDTKEFKKSLEEKAITTSKKGTKDERIEGLKEILNRWTETISAWTGVDGLTLANNIQEGISTNRRDWGSSGETQKWLKGVANSCPESVKKKYNPVQILEELRKAVGAVPRFTFKEAAIKNSEVKGKIGDLVKSIKAKEEAFQKDFKDKFEKGINNAIRNSKDVFGMTKSLSEVINRICSDEYYENKNYFEEGTPMYVAADNFKDILKDIISCQGNGTPKYDKCVKKLAKPWKELKKSINKGVMISIDVDLPELK
ncbi:MAG: hypothetical protein Q4B93_04330 [Clostridia bacterium]|nr:hypothetical protein [Clostridia bacterium]